MDLPYCFPNLGVNYSNKALIIFIRNPEKGKVKTRLARTLGDESALAIYNALLRHTRDIALTLTIKRFLFYSHYINQDDSWKQEEFVKKLQQGEDLGARMANAFSMALQTFNKAVIIGSDCPELTSDIIQQAFVALDTHPYAIGPALDGGYYLLGMRTPSPWLFNNMEWSTGYVLENTIQRIEAQNSTYQLLPTLSDVDEAEDWLRLQHLVMK